MIENKKSSIEERVEGSLCLEYKEGRRGIEREGEGERDRERD